jgi:hypothetical protein
MEADIWRRVICVDIWRRDEALGLVSVKAGDGHHDGGLLPVHAKRVAEGFDIAHESAELSGGVGDAVAAELPAVVHVGLAFANEAFPCSRRHFVRITGKNIDCFAFHP